MKRKLTPRVPPGICQSLVDLFDSLRDLGSYSNRRPVRTLGARVRPRLCLSDIRSGDRFFWNSIDTSCCRDASFAKSSIGCVVICLAESVSR